MDMHNWFNRDKRGIRLSASSYIKCEYLPLICSILFSAASIKVTILASASFAMTLSILYSPNLIFPPFSNASNISRGSSRLCWAILRWILLFALNILKDRLHSSGKIGRYSTHISLLSVLWTSGSVLRESNIPRSIVRVYSTVNEIF